MTERQPRLALATLVTAVTLLVLMIQPFGALRAQVVQAALRKTAPPFTATDSSGRTFRLSDTRGRVVLLDFWATWCTGCKVEIPWSMEFEKKYASRGLAAVGVAMDEEGWPVVRSFLQQHPISYPIVLGKDGPGALYHIANMPFTLLIDRAGRVADSHVGIVDKTAWDAEIRGLLAERVD
jgi:thiol-disulfide isomerase/thioredoxin